MTSPNRIIIAGGAGFLGQSFARTAVDRGIPVTLLTRGPSRQAGLVSYVHWDARTAGDWTAHLKDARAIVNVVGRTVDCRKSARNKRVILESRVHSVQALAHGCAAIDRPPPVWVQAATAHIFGDTGDELLDESSPIGTGFAPMVGTAWEKALHDVDLAGLRKVILRISFVLGRHGGALRTLARLARLGLGGRTGTGRQYMSWLHEDDLNAILHRAIGDPTMDGMYVATAPQPETNEVFMRTLRKQVHRPWSPPVPAWAVRIGAVLLRTDPELALYGRRCVPKRLLKEGFTFRFPDLSGALHDLLNDRPAAHRENA